MKLKTGVEAKNIPIVMLTGLDYELNRKLREQLGVVDYITKRLR
jgi:DNA-binding response OmpR family regulator